MLLLHRPYSWFGESSEVRFEVEKDSIHGVRQCYSSEKQNYEDDVWKNRREIHDLYTCRITFT